MKHILRVSMLILLFSLSCSQATDPQEKKKSLSFKAASKGLADFQPSAPDGLRTINQKLTKDKEKSTSEENNLQQPLYTPVKLADERLLEYRIKMQYACDNLPIARNHIIKIISKYGFIKNSHATVSTSYNYMNVELHIRVKELYEALTELDQLGSLKNETIQVLDHTEAHVWSTIKNQRELIRITRKNNAISGIAPHAKNWNSINSSLESSENTLDNVSIEKWKIKDKVTWAKVHIYLKTPENPEKIIVPKYTNAFKTLANFFLQLVYGLIIMLPFIGVGLLVFLKRKAIKSVFMKNKK